MGIVRANVKPYHDYHISYYYSYIITHHPPSQHLRPPKVGAFFHGQLYVGRYAFISRINHPLNVSISIQMTLTAAKDGVYTANVKPFHSVCLNWLGTILGHQITWQSEATPKSFSQPLMEAVYKRILSLKVASIRWSNINDLKHVKELFKEKVWTRALDSPWHGYWVLLWQQSSSACCPTVGQAHGAPPLH